MIESLDDWDSNDQMIVISGTTAETYMIDNYPDIPLQKYDSYATAKNALENGSGAAWVNDNTEVIAYALQNTGYTVGIPSLEVMIRLLRQFLKEIQPCLTGSMTKLRL